jgi:RNA polymerase sigma-70 factor (ECF subfamily)
MKTTADLVRLWTRHQPEVARYVATLVPNPHSAAEILQMVSVGLWEKWTDYDPNRPFVPWAIRFAYFEVLKWRQKQARERLIFSDQTLEHLHAAFENETPLQEARRAALEGCLKKLTPQDRTTSCSLKSRSNKPPRRASPSNSVPRASTGSV